MRPLGGLRTAVVGGGVLGSCIAALCAQAGARVSWFEPRITGDNASSVAAGMLSPAFEAIFETPSDYSLFSAGYTAWPTFAAGLRLPRPAEITAGGLYVGTEARMAWVASALSSLGVQAQMLDAGQTRLRQQALGEAAASAVFVGEDGRVDPLHLLQALVERVLALEGDVRRESFTPAMVDDFEAVVLATGFEARAWRPLAPELAHLEPIKGHVLHYAGRPFTGATVRTDDGYAAPQGRGVIFGATMEAGCSSLELDPERVRRLHERASALVPSLACTPYVARTGVRASTPDHRPLVGRSVGGLYVATGARRNGWLLAPLVAEAMVESLQGASPRAVFDPARFGRPSALAQA